MKMVSNLNYIYIGHVGPLLLWFIYSYIIISIEIQAFINNNYSYLDYIIM